MLTKKNQRLLKKCLDHWYENLMMLQLNFLSENEILNEDISVKGRDCAFCREYHQAFNENPSIEGCEGCPISEKTEQTTCDDTPYGDAHFYIEWNTSYEAMFQAIADEINFLESLKD